MSKSRMAPPGYLTRAQVEALRVALIEHVRKGGEAFVEEVMAELKDGMTVAEIEAVLERAARKLADSVKAEEWIPKGTA